MLWVDLDLEVLKGVLGLIGHFFLSGMAGRAWSRIGSWTSPP